MNTEQILGGIIVLLIGIIIGGTGGQALVKRAVGNMGQENSSNVAASAAASAAATAASSLNQHVGNLEASVSKQWDMLNDIRARQTKIAAILDQFPEMCKLKHDQIDRDQNRMQEQLTNLQTRG